MHALLATPSLAQTTRGAVRKPCTTQKGGAHCAPDASEAKLKPHSKISFTSRPDLMGTPIVFELNSDPQVPLGCYIDRWTS
jgi:hypothetical protein